MTSWTREEPSSIEKAEELELAFLKEDGTLRKPVMSDTGQSTDQTRRWFTAQPCTERIETKSLRSSYANATEWKSPRE